ncbi:hypothetical protein CCACVL1_15753 [Corchorus capsularis]|uniref:LOB domain-containing protein n=1 Tax=Corchorus capsularis TaxID=210143 RepID=A0A1R3I181_COCAP|nr:hypothetical protein CCACVL1_15753 [Corchorus capsularis]
MSVESGEDIPNSRHACAACKHQRKKCLSNCIFIPFYPATGADSFKEVQRIFGVKNLTHRLERLSTHEDRKKAVECLEWEAFAWKEDPINGPLGVLRRKEREIEFLKNQLMNYTANPIALQKVMPMVAYQNMTPYNHHNNSAGNVAIACNNNSVFTNFGYSFDNQNNLGFMDRSIYNNYGGFVMGGGEIGNQVTDYTVPFSAVVAQGQATMPDVNVAYHATPVAPKQETQMNHQSLDGAVMNRPAVAASFNQGRQYQQRGNQQQKQQARLNIREPFEHRHAD